MTQQSPSIPGYRADAQGRLVPEASIRDVDLLRDQLVGDLVTEVRQANEQLALLKGALFRRIAEHVALVASTYDADINGKAGGISLQSYDGRLKIERANGDRITVGEGVHAAEALVRDYLADATRSLAPAVVALVDRAFRRNPKTGGLNVTRLLDLMRVEIADERWQRAQQAVRDAIQTDGTTTYFRAYQRDSPDQSWQQIPLDFSAIAPIDAEEVHSA